ncbi:NAD(P)-dependent oxidoreductase [Clostridium sp.]|uniref:NAD(P)-dependent oxidoreductase n=1 Tax=Clostridium sp. TaxID=1506 RepID=UPI0028518B42|nr:NAD(P)-dependent oxidoreductase [Clostridium sp.]MDR3594250.1 NAD(P)-dependent oxidoreductase [Clostridium sp.]
MDKDDRKDIFKQGIDYSYISLISQKLRVGIIGGGKAGEIKAKHFVKSKCYVEVLSKTFSKGIIELGKCSQKFLKLIDEEFNYKFMCDKHLIIIAVDDEILKSEIKKYCNENYKIYIDSSDFSQGMGVIPVQRSTKNVTFALNTQYGNPKGAVFLSNKVESLIKEYDSFIEFIGKIRTKAKGMKDYKDDIIEFVARDEFRKAFDEGKSEEKLRLNFPKDIVDYLLL